MIKKILIGSLALIVLASTATVLYQQTQTASAQELAQAVEIQPAAVEGMQVEKDLQDNADAPYVASFNWLPGTDAGELSETESADLLYLREEEKLARDVYLALYELWGLDLFQNIAFSEQSHMDAVADLLVRYNLEDPALSQPGAFTDPELQGLYDQLLASGSDSLAEALKVGGAIEEIDILDLQASLAQTDNTDIQQVYNNLLRGSQNHLRSFATTLQNQTGEIYQPQYMTADTYQAILAGQAGGYGQAQGQGMQGQGVQGTGQGNQYRRGGQNAQP